MQTPVRISALAAVLVAVVPSGRSVPPVVEVKGLVAAEGLEATLFAEAPRITNPTNLEVDHRGRVWVVEGFNYRNWRNTSNPVREEGDRVVILEDTNRDGRADKETVFYQGRDIDAAMGIAVLGNRVIVSAYEHVLALTDTDGDDRADRKEVLFRFPKRNSHDHTVHAFVFGPDGRLYFNIGNESDSVMTAAGEVVVDRAGHQVIDQGKPYREGMVFRVEPDGSGFEVLGHNFRNPYEVALDSYGTMWQSDNDDDGNRATRINYVMEGGNFGYKDEVTGASWPSRRTGMEEEIPLRHWHLNDPGVVPNVIQTGAGSPSGITVYEGDLLPTRMRGALIHADPGPSVVRAYPLQSDGAGYTGEMVSLLTGPGDPWFRPVDVAVAPDGSLLVADWYDPGVGGHAAGDPTHGRVIRLAPRGASLRAPALELDTPEGAARALASPNQPTRYLAYTRLREWGVRAEPALLGLWRGEDPRDRARALWLLAQIPGRGEAHIAAAASDRHPDLRITALRAARRVGLDILPLAERLAADASPQVRREVALSIRHNTDPRAARIWSRLAQRHDGTDRWYLEALGIGADRQWDRFLAAWRADVGERWNTPGGRDIVWRSRSADALPLLGQLIRDPATREADRLRYFRALDFHSGPARRDLLVGLLDGAGPGRDQIAALALTHLDSADVRGDPRLRQALDRVLPAVAGTVQFVELVGKFDARDRTEELVAVALRDPQGTAGVEAARVALRWEASDRFRAALRGADPDAARRALVVLGNAGGLGLVEETVLDATRPLPVRQAAVQAFGQSLGGEGRLLRLVQEGKLADELKPAAATVLFGSYRNPTREAAAKLLTPPAATAAGGRALPSVGVLALRDGDPAVGRRVYARVCVACHTAGGVGAEFGPGLSEIGSKLSREGLYTAILHPDAGISFGYEGHLFRLRDGTETIGIVASETAGEVTLRMAGGLTQRIPKGEIASRSMLDRSLMPEGLQAAMTEDELVSLVEYLSTLRRAGG